MLNAACCRFGGAIIAKLHHTGPTGPDRTGPDQTKSAHFVGDRLNSTTRVRVVEFSYNTVVTKSSSQRTFLADESRRLECSVYQRSPVVGHVSPAVVVADDVVLHVCVNVVHTRSRCRLLCTQPSSSRRLNKAAVKRELIDNRQSKEASILWSHHEETRELPGEREIMQGTMPGARRRGRPRTAWMDNIKMWAGVSVEE